MLENHYMKGVEKFIENDHYVVWKFPASEDVYEKQARPLIYSYSLMTRGYGTCFNDDNFMKYFNDEGFDVYLIDWGTSALFSLSGWTMEDITGNLKEKVILPLLEQYGTDTLNVFGVCIGGAVLSTLLSADKEIAKKLHRVAYYGVPILGARDLGMEKTFREFYTLMEPYKELWWMKQSGLSLYFLDMLLLYSGSMSMVKWSWEQFLNENKNNSFFNIFQWTLDDRWVPFSAFMQIVERGFMADKEPHEFHMGGAENIHFLNVVGKDDMLVKPSASIVEWNSPIPRQFKSFKQIILDTGHFMFARPGFEKEKQEIAQWFAGYSLPSVLYKLKHGYEKAVGRAGEIIPHYVAWGYDKATDDEKKELLQSLSLLTKTESDDIGALAGQLVQAVKEPAEPGIYDMLDETVMPVIEKSSRR